MAKSAISRAVASERLYRVYDGVYSVVPPELMTDDAKMAAAVLAGGPGALLCGPSAAWWLKLIDTKPPIVHVAVAGPRRPVSGIRWHRLKLTAEERANVSHMPVTTPTRVALDVAAGSTLFELKTLLAELEFHYGIEAIEVAKGLRKGYPGSARLRRAIEEHTPQLARTREALELAFAAFLIEYGFALPEFNYRVGRSTVDAAYIKEKVIVELDGLRGHSGERRILRDHRRDLHRRADGNLVLRYHYTQLMNPDDRLLIVEDLDRAGIPRTGRLPSA